ncbi:hypothetical protein V1478_014411 [Vespula squamosa]|uniref:Uncharacterized protein n=1 Tax=Vespula squamosa TaxID=30214 RepID=A0ABD2AAK4_VESSQ
MHVQRSTEWQLEVLANSCSPLLYIIYVIQKQENKIDLQLRYYFIEEATIYMILQEISNIRFYQR